MFGFGRGRVPFVFPLFILLAIVGVSVLGSAGGAPGFLLFLPLLAVKMFFFLFLFGVMLRFVRGGTPWGGSGRRGPWGPPREPTEEERERAEAERLAREEVDALFPDL